LLGPVIYRNRTTDPILSHRHSSAGLGDHLERAFKMNKPQRADLYETPRNGDSKGQPRYLEQLPGNSGWRPTGHAQINDAYIHQNTAKLTVDQTYNVVAQRIAYAGLTRTQHHKA